MSAPVRIVIVDDQMLFRLALTRVLEEDERVDVIGTAASGEEAIKVIDSDPPDVVLLDLRMHGMDGVETTRQILSRHKDVRVLILTSYDNDAHVLEAMRAGASGYMLKDSSPAAVISSINAVLLGTRVMTRSISERVFSMLQPGTPGQESEPRLTPREHEILKLMATGVANKQIAQRIGISDKTVRNHVSAIYLKLRISDRSQAALYAVRTGLIDI